MIYHHFMNFLLPPTPRPENVWPIIRNNFNPSMSKRQAFGCGLYFSEFPSISFRYGEALILCRVLTGKVQMGGSVLRRATQ